MTNFLSIIFLGFFLGMRHATDPDHVVAVATIVTRRRDLGRASLIGAFWGIGHTLTILTVGAAIILFGVVVPARVGLLLELAVGVMLVVLGFVNVRGGFGSGASSVPHDHAEDASTHTHESHALADDVPGVFCHLRPLLVGIVHGLAGSAAVALLVLTLIRDPRWAVAYLVVFGVGTVAGMMIITVSIAGTLRVAAGKSAGIARHLAFASGVLSVVVGLFIAYQVCFAHGIFTFHATWRPQ